MRVIQTQSYKLYGISFTKVTSILGLSEALLDTRSLMDLIATVTLIYSFNHSTNIIVVLSPTFNAWMLVIVFGVANT